MEGTAGCVKEIADAVRAGKTSAVQVTEQWLASIRSRNKAVSAFVCVHEEGALAQARRIDEKAKRGEPLGLLAGVPIAVKDNICVKGIPTTCSSKMLESFRPPYHATVTERLLSADAVLVGKTNLDEFAMGSSTENSGFFPTRNPWDTARSPGGSSGGSAAAVAARMVPAALGSDTGGSIRQPAAFCGVLGLKPTYGRVSRYGLVAFASSLDQIGPIARTAQDAASLLQVIAGHDERDSTCMNQPVPDYCADLNAPIDGLRMGLPREFFEEGLSREVKSAVLRAVSLLEEAGATVKEVSLPHSEYAIAAYYIVANAEASSNLARYDGVHYGFRAEGGEDIVEMYSLTRRDGFGTEVKRRIMVGTYALSAGYYEAYYLKAAKVRALIRRDFDVALEEVDCIVCPSTPTPPFRLGEKTDNPLEMYLSDVYTVSLNLAGLPGLSMPCGFTDEGLPVGMQVWGRAWEEELLLRVAHAFQAMTDYHEKEPAL